MGDGEKCPTQVPSRTVQCHACGGKGYIIRWTTRPRPPEECELCNGSGYVTVVRRGRQ